MLFVYWFLLPLRLVWLLVCCLYKEVYLQNFKCVSFWLHGCCGEWEGGPVNQVNHTSWVAVVTPTDRPKSVRNCCWIELFVALFVLSLCPFDISVGVGAFVIGLGQISSFLCLHIQMHNLKFIFTDKYCHCLIKKMFLYSILIFPPWGPGGLSRECAPPYPQRDRKRRLNGAVCRNHRIKRLVPCRC